MLCLTSNFFFYYFLGMLVTKYYETSCVKTSVCGDTMGKDFQVFQSKILFPNENISRINIHLYQTIIEQ